MKRAAIVTGAIAFLACGSAVVAQRIGPNLFPKEIFYEIGQAAGSYQSIIKQRVDTPTGPTLTEKELYVLVERIKYFDGAIRKMEPQRGLLEVPKDLDDFGKGVLLGALACNSCGEMKGEGRLKEFPHDLAELRTLLLERCALLDRELTSVLKNKQPISRPALSRINAYLFYMQTITIWYGRLDAT
jgi:hypothetical protein